MSSRSRMSLIASTLTWGAALALLATTGCSSVTVAPASEASSSSQSPQGGSMMDDGDDGHDMMQHGAGAMTDADLMFLAMMIPHHEQAIEMSKLASTNGASPAVQSLADAIAAAQGPEIEQMKAWLDEANAPDMMGDGHMAMSGVLSASQMDALAAARGREFDRLYLEGMIGHHQGAVEMAQDEIDAGGDPRVVDLATAIVAAQKAEIDQMTAMLAQ